MCSLEGWEVILVFSACEVALHGFGMVLVCCVYSLEIKKSQRSRDGACSID